MFIRVQTQKLCNRRCICLGLNLLIIVVVVAADTQISLFGKEDENPNSNFGSGRNGRVYGCWFSLPGIRPIGLPGITTPTPISGPTCTEMTEVPSTESCLCGVAVCSAGQHCTRLSAGASVCSTPTLCSDASVSLVPCTCGMTNSVTCLGGEVCSTTGGVPSCTTPAQCIETGVNPAPCNCSARLCTAGEYCTRSTSVCSPPPPATTECGVGTATQLCNCLPGGGTVGNVCQAGQNCNSAGVCERPPCQIGAVASEFCVCGTTTCSARQTCLASGQCDPPPCLVETTATKQCICAIGAELDVCEAGESCLSGMLGNLCQL